MTILIAGGGIGGVSAALALAQQGFQVRVLERAPEFGEIGFGIQLGPNAFHMLERLGVRDFLEAQAFFPNHLVMQDAVSGKEVSRIHLKGAFVKQYGRPYAVIHRRDLHGALIDGCRALPGQISLEVNSGLKSFKQDGGRVQVTLDDGREVEGDLLICADGLRSVGRQQILGDGEPRVSGHIAHRGVVPIEEVTDTRFIDDMVIWVGPNLHLVQYRLRGGKVLNNVCVIESEEYKQGKMEWGSMTEVHRTFEGMVPYVKDALKFISPERAWAMWRRIGSGIGEEVVIEAHLGRHRICRRNPMQRRLNFPPIGGRVAAARFWIVGAAQFDDGAIGVLHDITAGDEIGIAQPHLFAGRQAVEFLRRRQPFPMTALSAVLISCPGLAEASSPAARRA